MGARAGRRDDVSAGSFEDLNCVFRYLLRIASQTGVELGLSAAGLVAREFHIKAEAVEYIHHRLADLREEGVSQTGDEELNGGHGWTIRRAAFPASTYQFDLPGGADALLLVLGADRDLDPHRVAFEVVIETRAAHKDNIAVRNRVTDG